MQPEFATIHKLAYTIHEAVAATGIGRSTLYFHLKTGSLRPTKIGRRTVILADELARWLASFSNNSSGLSGGENE